jgi:hypothetical protein
MDDREHTDQSEEHPPVRKNPPLIPDAGMGDGGISMSGGASGGARGHGGTSDRGAGSPTGEGDAGPGEYKASSRFDYDRRDSDLDESAGREDDAASE